MVVEEKQQSNERPLAEDPAPRPETAVPKWLHWGAKVTVRDGEELWHGRVVGKQRGMPGYFVVNFGGDGDSGLFFYATNELSSAAETDSGLFPPLGECHPRGSAIPIPDRNGDIPAKAKQKTQQQQQPALQEPPQQKKAKTRKKKAQVRVT